MFSEKPLPQSVFLKARAIFGTMFALERILGALARIQAQPF